MRRRRVLFPAVVLAGALTVAPGAAWAVDPIVYTIEPLGGADTTPSLFGGAVCATYECVKVPTDATLDSSHSEGVFGEDGSISDGAATLNSMLVGDDGEKVVFGFSQGAQIAGFWLRNYAPDTTVQPSNTSFLLVGDPENTYGVPWAPRVPTNTGFAVTEVWAQYDGWADWPSRFDLLATSNAVYGMLFVHPTVYDDLDLEAERALGNVVTWESEGITYVMVVEEDLPMLDPLRNIGLGWVADLVNDNWRSHIEEQYDRPATQAEADAMFGPAQTQTQAEDEVDDGLARPSESAAELGFSPAADGEAEFAVESDLSGLDVTDSAERLENADDTEDYDTGDRRSDPDELDGVEPDGTVAGDETDVDAENEESDEHDEVQHDDSGDHDSGDNAPTDEA